MNTQRISCGDTSLSYQEGSTSRHRLWSGAAARMGILGLGLVLCLGAQAQRTATGTATVINGFVIGVTVTDPGEGYIIPPSVTFRGGGGSGATATANLSGSGVGSITVTAAGSGYATVPDVVIGPPDVVSSILDLRMIPEITIFGEIGATNQIQWVNAFGDTNAWAVLTNLVLPSSPYVFYDTMSPKGAQRFYRAIVGGGGARPAAPAGFVYIPPGRFTMGSSSTEQDRGGDEGPQTVVTLSRGIFMGAHEVTQAEYLAVVGANPSGFTGDANRPVEMVSWNDAVNYCVKLTDQERTAGRLPSGWAYRLPREAEWEYAGRCGRTNRFSWSDDLGYSLLGEYAWFASNSGNRTHAVAGKRPNRWGLHDMNGNVWEWCSDWYDAYPGGTVTDPKGADEGLNRVTRGGGWENNGYACRSAQRNAVGPDGRSSYYGFRAVLASGQ